MRPTLRRRLQPAALPEVGIEALAGRSAIVLEPVSRHGGQIKLAGDLYLTGRPEVRDNFLEVPDIQHTVETRDALLKLKTSLDGEAIRREVLAMPREAESLRAEVRAMREKVRSARPVPAGRYDVDIEALRPSGVTRRPVEVSDEVRPGVVSLPHGFGHDLAGVRMAVARAHGGDIYYDSPAAHGSIRKPEPSSPLDSHPAAPHSPPPARRGATFVATIARP